MIFSSNKDRTQSKNYATQIEYGSDLSSFHNIRNT